MELDLTSTAFWIAVGQIILIDIVLSGDNAVVIALACRNLSPEQRRTGIFWGVAGAVSLRVVLTVFAALVMNLPWLKFVGGLLLVWIAVKLMLPEDEDGHDIEPSAHLWGAVKTIVIADFVMSLDNVIAVAAAAHGSMLLVVFGILVSIPIVVWGSQLVLKLMDRYPIVITGGGALLGWIGGGMIVSDPALPAGLLDGIPYPKYVLAALGALLVIGVGKWLAMRTLRLRPARAPEDLLAEDKEK